MAKCTPPRATGTLSPQPQLLVMSTLTSCPSPFVDQSAHPYTSGYRPGRLCGPFGSTLTCCLPCPTETWFYSNTFERNKNIAYWFNVPALICQVFLLFTFAVLKKKHSHVHYLSIGFHAERPPLEHVLWMEWRPAGGRIHGWSYVDLRVLLRALWTQLRVVADVQHTTTFFWVAQALGWGVPALFLAISLPVTGVSYQLGTTCFPNEHDAFITWFGWLLAFGCLAALLQFLTTGFCLGLYIRHFFVVESNSSHSRDNSESAASALSGLQPGAKQRPRRASVHLGRKLAWKRVRKVLLVQWRSILMSLLVTLEIVYFGVVFVAETRAARADDNPAPLGKIEAWAACLVLTKGDKEYCLLYTEGLSLSEGVVIASLFMSVLIGIFTFLLMVRSSMFVGWWELIRSPLRSRRVSRPEEFGLANSKQESKRDSAGVKSMLDGVGILSEPSESVRQASVPELEAGDVTERHGTTNWFDEEAYEEAERTERERKARMREEGLDDI
ncbi:hypothetical protein LTR78_000997 [Recurvomyces mirabilis]|uniref:G-protein coupled receptors family 2 profile 2 domain-containing protein n=1 Tax=Recurvomyces mirabilis TaxID=574656 RepID=A0AAE1C629_9PEZI|nr:hypothetical protein LTR78_000997 [Recurvomyces mirabilis]KAK5158969.1 hypothetical protein LTS14_003077 [Recurvomyces mirabilis]